MSYAWQEQHTRQLWRDEPVDNLSTASREPILEDCKNLDLAEPKLFRAARQDDHGICDCAWSRKLLTKDVACYVIGAMLRTSCPQSRTSKTD